MKKIVFLITLIFSINIFAEVTPDTDSIGASPSSISAEDRTKLKAPLMNIFSTTDWSIFLQEFEIKLKVGFCGKGLDKAIGLKAHMIEPIGYFENVKKPLYFPFADLDLGGNIIKSGHSRATIEEESGRDEFVWSHFIYVPIMGMIFKKKIPIFCFADGDLSLPLINEFLPMYSKDLMYKNMIAPMVLMFTPQGLLSTVLDCSAVVADNLIHFGVDGSKGSGIKGTNDDIENFSTTYPDYDTASKKADQESLGDKGEEYLKFVRNSMYFSVGCLGFAPVGGYIEAQDPGVDNEMLLYQSINLLHGASSVLPAPFLYKQTNFGMEGGKNNNVQVMDTMCAPSKYPMGIESQYVPQRAFPTVGDPHELGMTPVATTTAANVPGSKDSFVHVVWERRDYYAFAYFCPGGKD